MEWPAEYVQWLFFPPVTSQSLLHGMRLCSWSVFLIKGHCMFGLSPFVRLKIQNNLCVCVPLENKMPMVTLCYPVPFVDVFCVVFGVPLHCFYALNQYLAVHIIVSLMILLFVLYAFHHKSELFVQAILIDRLTSSDPYNLLAVCHRLHFSCFSQWYICDFCMLTS